MISENVSYFLFYKHVIHIYTNRNNNFYGNVFTLKSKNSIKLNRTNSNITNVLEISKRFNYLFIFKYTINSLKKD